MNYFIEKKIKYKIPLIAIFRVLIESGVGIYENGNVARLLHFIDLDDEGNAVDKVKIELQNGKSLTVDLKVLVSNETHIEAGQASVYDLDFFSRHGQTPFFHDNN
tara:strand:- start:4115 stop:4429 length:315 start_codon:yes stop_codon:yes gene_type:complete